MGSVDDTLLVRHLPSQLSNGDKEELLRHFGAVRVKVMGARGAMKHTAFVTFSDSMHAAKALNRLHQLEVLGCKLVAEFAKKSHQKHFPSISDNQRGRKVTEEKQDKRMEDKTQNLPSADTVYKKWGVNYPKNPKLCYLYPPPTVSIITNIANALASCPRLYVQVLHLMNKMNLPAPFGAVTPTPPIPLKESAVIREPDNTKTEAMDVSSTEESEIESEGESQKKSTDQPSLKRHMRKKPKLSSKRPRFLENLEIPAQSNVPVMMPSKVFENVQEQLQAKKIQMKIPEAIIHEQPPQEITNPEPGFLSDVLSSLNRAEEITTDGGFGKIEPVKKISENVEIKDTNLPYTVDSSKFLTIEDIKKGRISQSEWKNYSVFRKYEAGDRTKRLYLKNLNKHTSEQDLVDIFGNYIDWNSETEKSMFDIRVMKEGRMKGQGFITFPSEESAERAMHDTNGFTLNNKPMAVQFARSAKAKDATEEKS
ncbi:RNA-binding region-containing protein 3-like [Mytilus galloprovincialis]|uniref:RNA-binding region-containing protein 3-like n=1 Tax=Mytilus galloprovincialis TaxID=29158 RepID=UPI003F7C1A97